MRMALAICLVCILGAGALYWQTDGFTAVTTESARRADIRRQPRLVPDAALAGLPGHAAGALREELRRDGRLTIVDFMYTRCASLCLAMGTEFQQMQQAIKDRGLQDRVRLLSLSFDPTDTPRLLQEYGRRMRADPAVWDFAALPAAAGREAVLKAFGIVVVLAPLGQYEHNAAYHAVSAGGYLTRIVDIGDAEALLDYAERAAPAVSAGRRAASGLALVGGGS